MHLKKANLEEHGEINSDMFIVSDFNTLLTSMGGCSRWKINKNIQIFIDVLEQMNLIEIFRAIPPQSSRVCIPSKGT